MTEDNPIPVIAERVDQVTVGGLEDWEGFSEALAGAKTQQHQEHHDPPPTSFHKVIAHWAAEEGWD